jgi:hypothetical protein
MVCDLVYDVCGVSTDSLILTSAITKVRGQIVGHLAGNGDGHSMVDPLAADASVSPEAGKRRLSPSP